MVAQKILLPNILHADAIINKLPDWVANRLPESLRPQPAPPTLWQQMHGTWIAFGITMAVLVVCAVLWSKYGLSPYAVWNRIFSFRSKAQSKEMLMLLQRSMGSDSAAKKVAMINDSDKTQKPSIDSDHILQDYFGYRAVMEVQKANKALNDAAKAKGSDSVGKKSDRNTDAAKLPPTGSVVESLMRAIPIANRSIPLWIPATKSNHEWYSISLALPAPLLKNMQNQHANLPEPFLVATRLGLVYHRVCQQRKEDAHPSPPESSINAENLPVHKSHDMFDRPLQALWTVALCPESYSRTGAQWKRLGFTSEDPIIDLKDGGMGALEDFTWFASTYPAAHREMLLYTAKKRQEAAASHVPAGVSDAFSEVAASFLLSVMLTKIPKAFADEESDFANKRSEPSSGGEAASPLLDDSKRKSRSLDSYAPLHRDGSSLQFTPLMLRYLYGGATEVSMLAAATPSSNVPRDKLPYQPTTQDEKAVRHRLKQLHACYLRAYFDLWKKEEPLSQELFLLKTFYSDSGMLVDGYLGKIMS